MILDFNTSMCLPSKVMLRSFSFETTLRLNHIFEQTQEILVITQVHVITTETIVIRNMTHAAENIPVEVETT